MLCFSCMEQIWNRFIALSASHVICFPFSPVLQVCVRTCTCQDPVNSAIARHFAWLPLNDLCLDRRPYSVQSAFLLIVFMCFQYNARSCALLFAHSATFLSLEMAFSAFSGFCCWLCRFPLSFAHLWLFSVHTCDHISCHYLTLIHMVFLAVNQFAVAYSDVWHHSHCCWIVVHSDSTCKYSCSPEYVCWSSSLEMCVRSWLSEIRCSILDWPGYPVRKHQSVGIALEEYE